MRDAAGIYRPTPVSEQPDIEIVHWSVRQLPDGDRHLMGVIPTLQYDGRVTSKIMHVEGRIVRTRSGRRYHLEGEPGFHPNASHVWNAWCRLNGIESNDTTDVTNEYT